MSYIVFWKEGPGQQVTTVVNDHDQPVERDVEYLQTQGISTLESDDEVFEILRVANGVKYGITPELARRTLGWDL